MADDDKDQHDDSDPWADLESVSFDDADLDADLDGGVDGALIPADSSHGQPDDRLAGAADPAADNEASPGSDVFGSFAAEADPAETDDDALVNAWLEGSGEGTSEPPLSVFAPDETVDHGHDALDDAGSVAGADATSWHGDPATIEIGTGESVVSSPSDLMTGSAGDQADDGAAQGAADVAIFEPETTGTVDGGSSRDDEQAATADVISFGAAVAGAAPLVADTTARPAKRPRGVLRQLRGVVLGGLLAIPIVLGILVGMMWMGWRDEVGIRSWLPAQLAFLLPAAGRDPSAGPDLSAAPTLDDLPATALDTAAIDGTAAAGVVAASDPVGDSTEPSATDSSPVDPVNVPVDPVDSVASDAVGVPESSEPMTAAAMDPTADDSAAHGGESSSREFDSLEHPSTDAASTVADVASTALPVDLEAIVAPVEAAVEAAGRDPSAIPASPLGEFNEAVIPVPEPAVTESAASLVAEPEPLDLTAVEAAVAEATAGLDRVQAGGAADAPTRKKALVAWYRSLVRLAEELALLEQAAADTGRPLHAPPDAVAGLHARLFAAEHLTGELASLGRDWLGYAHRQGDGVVLPATFRGCRRVGPYWSSRLSLSAGDGVARELAVISRLEPVAAAGEQVLVTGLLMADGVIVATDIRTAAPVAAASGPAAAFEEAPFTAAEP